MTKHEALVKLLALGEMRRSAIYAVTGWGVDTTSQVISECREQCLIARKLPGTNHSIMGGEVFAITKKGRNSYASNQT